MLVKAIVEEALQTHVLLSSREEKLNKLLNWGYYTDRDRDCLGSLREALEVGTVVRGRDSFVLLPDVAEAC